MFGSLKRLFRSSPAEPSQVADHVGRRSVESAATGPAQAYQGCFEPLFRGTDYLTLLGLPPASSSALRFIADVVRENPECRQHVLALLGDPGWRLHLVAAIAVLVSRDRTDLNRALWDTLDRGSWVAPQLAVVLAMCDPQFVPQAKQRIIARCPVTPAALATAIQQHVIAGPGTGQDRSAKNLASLLYLVRTIPSEAEWAETTSQAPDLQQLLQSDRDECDKLVAFWAAALRERFAELNLPLPKAAV